MDCCLGGYRKQSYVAGDIVDTKAAAWTFGTMLGEKLEEKVEDFLTLLLKHHASVPPELTHVALEVVASLNALAMEEWTRRQRIAGIAMWRQLFLESRRQVKRRRRLKKFP